MPSPTTDWDKVRMMAYLLKSEYTIAELSATLRIGKRTVWRYLALLRREGGDIVHRRRRDGKNRGADTYQLVGDVPYLPG